MPSYTEQEKAAVLDLTKDFQVYRADLDGRVDALSETVEGHLVNQRAANWKMQSSIAEAALDRQRRGVGGAGRPGALLDAVRVATGLPPAHGFEPARDSQGRVVIPLREITAALTVEHVVPALPAYQGLGVPRAGEILRDPRLGARHFVVGDSEGQIRMPIASGSAASFASDGDKLVDLGLNSAALTFEPHRCGAIFGFEFSLLAMSDIMGAENAIASDMISAIYNAIDTALVASSQGAAAPAGFSGAAAVTTGIAVNGSAISRSLLDAQLSRLEAANFVPTTWIMNPATARALNSIPLFSGSAAPLLTFETGGARLLDLPVVQSGLIPVNGVRGTGQGLHEVFAVDGSQVISAVWGSVQLESGLSGDDFSKSRRSLRAQIGVDVQPLRVTAIDRVSAYIV